MYVDTLGLGFWVPAEKLRVYLAGASSGLKKKMWTTKWRF